MCRETAIHPPVELHTFVYADSEWDERPEDGNIFAEGVVAAARDLARADQERLEIGLIAPLEEKQERRRVSP